jgi:hypothetical protein
MMTRPYSLFLYRFAAAGDEFASQALSAKRSSIAIMYRIVFNEGSLEFLTRVKSSFLAMRTKTHLQRRKAKCRLALNGSKVQ